MKHEWTDGELTCQLHASVVDVPGSAWDEHIAGAHPLKSSRFMRCLEESFPDRRFAYLTVFQNARMVGLAVVTEEHFDVGLLLPNMATRLSARVRRFFPGFLTFRLAMVGTFETMKRHWWFDEQGIGSAQFADIMLAAVNRAFPHARLLIVRDLAEGNEPDKTFERDLSERGFRAVYNLPLATISLDGLTIDQHLARLKSKNKTSIRKTLRGAENKSIKIERVRDFGPLIDECYPLYLQVHQKATEFKRQPIPKAFFHGLAVRLAAESSMLVIRDERGQLLAFMLTGTSNDVNNPFLIGIDYRYSRELPLYYLLLWGEIAYAAERGCREVDMGVTSYFIKQTMGATLEAMSMAARMQTGWLRPLLNPLLPALLSERQPQQRRQFKQSGADGG